MGSSQVRLIDIPYQLVASLNLLTKMILTGRFQLRDFWRAPWLPLMPPTRRVAQVPVDQRQQSYSSGKIKYLVLMVRHLLDGICDSIGDGRHMDISRAGEIIFRLQGMGQENCWEMLCRLYLPLNLQLISYRHGCFHWSRIWWEIVLLSEDDLSCHSQSEKLRMAGHVWFSLKKDYFPALDS